MYERRIMLGIALILWMVRVRLRQERQRQMKYPLFQLLQGHG